MDERTDTGFLFYWSQEIYVIRSIVDSEPTSWYFKSGNGVPRHTSLVPLASFASLKEGFLKEGYPSG
jgi:hypothetical protein